MTAHIAASDGVSRLLVKTSYQSQFESRATNLVVTNGIVCCIEDCNSMRIWAILTPARVSAGESGCLWFGYLFRVKRNLSSLHKVGINNCCAQRMRLRSRVSCALFSVCKTICFPTQRPPRTRGPPLSSVQSSEPRRLSPAIVALVRNWPSKNWEVWCKNKFLRRCTAISFPTQEKLGPAAHRKARGFRHHLCVDLSTVW